MSWQRSLPTVAAPRSSAAVSVASPVPRAIVLETLSQELTARELRKLAQRQRQAQQAEEQQESTKRLRRRKTDMRLWRGQSKAATPTDGAARVVELPSSTEQTGNAASKPRTLVRTRSAVSPSSRKQLRAKEEASHEERALEAEAQRKQAEEVYAKWLAQKRARLREAAAAKRAQEEQQRLEAQEAQRRREMARERMAAWLKAKDAQLRTKREAETAAQAEAERDKAEWLSQRRNRLAATLRRIESRAQRKTGRGSRLSVSHSRHGHGTAGATAHGDGEAEPRDERTATGTAPTKPAAVRRHASRPNASSGKTMRTTVADSSSRGASVVGTAAAPLLSSPLESKLLPPRQAQHQEHSLALPVLSPRSGRRRDIGRAKSAKPQAHGSRQRSRPGKPRHRQASSYDSADSRLRKWQASTVTTGGMYMPQLLLAATPTSNPHHCCRTVLEARSRSSRSGNDGLPSAAGARTSGGGCGGEQHVHRRPAKPSQAASGYSAGGGHHAGLLGLTTSLRSTNVNRDMIDSAAPSRRGSSERHVGDTATTRPHAAPARSAAWNDEQPPVAAGVLAAVHNAGQYDGALPVDWQGRARAGSDDGTHMSAVVEGLPGGDADLAPSSSRSRPHSPFRLGSGSTPPPQAPTSGRGPRVEPVTAKGDGGAWSSRAAPHVPPRYPTPPPEQRPPRLVSGSHLGERNLSRGFEGCEARVVG